METFNTNNLIKKTANFVGPQKKPILGNTVKRSKQQQELFEALKEKYPDYPDTWLNSCITMLEEEPEYFRKFKIKNDKVKRKEARALHKNKLESSTVPGTGKSNKHYGAVKIIPPEDPKEDPPVTLSFD